MNHKPSEPALRAAERLHEKWQYESRWVEDAAHIIDQETKVGEKDAEIAKLNRFNQDLIEETCAIDDICDSITGCPQGDSYGVPSTIEKVQWLYGQYIKATQQAREKALGEG